MKGAEQVTYECVNPACHMVGHIDARRICLGCGETKRPVKP